MADNIERVPLWTKIGFGFGHVMNDMCASMWFTYLLLFFHKVLDFNNLGAGVILMIGQLADGLSTVFVGYFSDTNDDLWLCNKVGKRKAWHLIGTLCVLGSFPFIFVPCITCSMSHESAQLVYYAAFVIIFQFGWAAVQISHLAAIPDIANSQNERTGLTAIRYSMTVASNIIVYLCAWGLLDKAGRDDQISSADASSFKNLMTICLGAGICCTIFYHYTVKIGDNNSSEEDEGENSGLNRQTSRTPVFRWFKEYQLYQVATVYMATRLFVNLSQAYVPLFLQVTLQLPARYVATVPLTMYISGLAASFGMKRTNNFLGRKITYVIGACIGISACLWTEFGCDANDAGVKYFVYVIAGILGFGGTIMLVTSLALTAEFIDTDTDASAFIYGVMSLTDKVSNGLAVVIIQNFIPLDTDTCIKCRQYYRHVLLFACGGAALLGVFGIISMIKTTVGTRRPQFRQSLVINDEVDEPDERTPLI